MTKEETKENKAKCNVMYDNLNLQEHRKHTATENKLLLTQLDGQKRMNHGLGKVLCYK